MSLANLFKLTQSYPAGHVLPSSWPPVGIRADVNNNDRPNYQIPKNLQAYYLSFFDGDFQFTTDERFSKLDLDGIIAHRFNETLLCAMLRYPEDPFVVHAAEYLYNFTVDFSPHHTDLPLSCQVNDTEFLRKFHLEAINSRIITINCMIFEILT